MKKKNRDQDDTRPSEPYPIITVHAARPSTTGSERRHQPRRALDYARSLMQTALDAMERIGYGLAILDKSRRVVYATDSARGMLATCEAWIEPTNERLTFAHQEHQRQFDRVAERVCGCLGGPVAACTFVVQRVPPRCPLEVSSLPLSVYPAQEFSDSHYLMVLHDPGHQPEFRWQWLGERFGLTAAELRLCRALADGLSPAEYAHKQFVTLNTARTQLKSIYSKMSVHRQPELIRLLLTLPHPI